MKKFAKDFHPDDFILDAFGKPHKVYKTCLTISAEKGILKEKVTLCAHGMVAIESAPFFEWDCPEDE